MRSALMSTIVKSLSMLFVAGALAALVTGCSETVGEGVQPVDLYLGLNGEEEAVDMAECTSQTLNAYVVFEGKGGQDIATYNDRVQWSSENPSVVFVSDGVTPSPEGSVYAAGTLIALRPGIATISASYLDFHASITVDASEMSDLHIVSDLTDIGAELDQGFTLETVLSEGEPAQDITTSAQWRFDPATAKAYVDNTTGVVHANSSTDGEQLRLVARLPECDREVSKSFRISPVTSLQIDYERGDATILPYNFSESFKVTAGFADTSAPRQDVTSQMTVDSIDDDYIAASLVDDTYTVTAEDRTGSGALELTLDPLDLTVTTKTWQVQNLTLLNIELSPDDAQVTYPDTGQLTVIGTFDNGMQMPVTRHVGWTSSDTNVATIGTSDDTAGEVTITNINANVDITAAINVDDETLEDTITLHAYANDHAE